MAKANTLSRRGFLKASAATGALVAAAGAAAFAPAAEEAYAAGGNVTRTPSTCNGCSNKCGLWALSIGGRVWRVEGNPDHSKSGGTLCARGHGFAQLTYSAERLTQPLRKVEGGGFEPITWDEAFSEIGEKLKGIIAQHAPESFAFIQDPRPSGSFYTARFTAALGSANQYTHGAACNLSKESGNLHTLGGSFSADVANSKMIMFIGRSYADGITPTAVKGLADVAAKKSAKIVMVDPRYNNTARFADEWVPIVPGTDIAFVLAMCNVLIAEELYDKAFVDQYVLGFEEFAAEIRSCTPAWAEGICGVSADRIARLAREMAAAAPAALIEPSWRAAFGCAHANSFDTARAVAAFNALLGCYGQRGGAIFTSSPKFGALSAELLPPTPMPEKKKLGMEEYPLAAPGMGTNLAVLKAALDGDMHAVFFYNSNGARGYAQIKAWTEGLAKVDLVVVIDIQMTETALLADYVLPECSYLERMEVPEMLGGKKHAVTMRVPAVERVHPETKPIDEIITGLAKACGVGEYFPFTIEELASAQLATIGLTIDDLREQGVVALPDPQFTYGAPASYKTPSGKIEFKSDVVEAAGLKGTISYTERKAWPGDDEFFFVGGKQSIHCHTMSTNVESLMDVSKEYGLERLWISTKDAAVLGIEDDDMVEISSSEHVAQVRAHVTERILPGVVFLPSHFGGSSPQMSHAFNYGVDVMSLVPFDMEPGCGSAMSQEVVVKVRKVNA